MQKYKLILSADKLHVINCDNDAEFTIGSYLKRHTDGIRTYGRGVNIL